MFTYNINANYTFESNIETNKKSLHSDQVAELLEKDLKEFFKEENDIEINVYVDEDAPYVHIELKNPTPIEDLDSALKSFSFTYGDTEEGEDLESNPYYWNYDIFKFEQVGDALEESKDNELDKMAKFNKKHNKGKGWFVKLDAGNVPLNNATFNSGVGVTEAMDKEKVTLIYDGLKVDNDYISYEYNIDKSDVEDYLANYVVGEMEEFDYEEPRRSRDINQYVHDHFDELFDNYYQDILDNFETWAIDEAAETYEPYDPRDDYERYDDLDENKGEQSVNMNKNINEYCEAGQKFDFNRYHKELKNAATAWRVKWLATEIAVDDDLNAAEMKDLLDYAERRAEWFEKHGDTSFFQLNPGFGDDIGQDEGNFGRFIFKEDRENKKYKTGDETILTPYTPEYTNFKYVAKKLDGKVEDTYLDYGQKWMWTTIIKDGAQILYPNEWLKIANAQTAQELDDVIDKYNREHNKFGKPKEDLTEAEVKIPQDKLFNPSSISLTDIAKTADEKEKAELAAKERSVKLAEAQDLIDEIANTPDKDRLQVAFDKLVPESGKASTQAGEIVRALMRIEYRDWNDGDVFYKGYGLETCGGSMAYLMDIVPGVEEAAERIIEEDPGKGDEYTQSIKDIEDMVLDYILFDEEGKSAFVEENTIDSINYDTTVLEESQPYYEIEIPYSDKLIELIDEGRVDLNDIDDYIDNYLQDNSRLRRSNIYTELGDTGISVEGLTQDGYDEIEYSLRDVDSFWEGFIEDYVEEEGEEDSNENLNKPINIREELNKIDSKTYCEYDLLNSYNSIKWDEKSQNKLIEKLNKKASPRELNRLFESLLRKED